MNNSSYLFQTTEALTGTLVKIDSAIEKIKQLQNNKPNIWGAIQQKLRAEWTFDSNAIEGSTLTLGETIFFLQEGLTVEGKPLKDFLDARNHAEAIDMLFDVVAQKREISESLIKEINALLLVGVKSTPAIDGEPLQVPLEMQQLCEWVNQQSSQSHALIVAGIAHYNMVRIHPFDDGNGRGARILMNLVLLTQGYTPVIVRNAKRRDYLQALAKADSGELIPFLQFIADSMLETQRMIIGELEGTNHKEQ